MGIMKILTPLQSEELLKILQTRFRKNMHRHEGIKWHEIQTRLEKNSGKLWSLKKMEETGGEPDVAGYDNKTDEFLFYDCSKESPKGRRSVCYDRDALESRKAHKPERSASGMAAEIGIEMLTEEQYRELQKLGEFDTKTSSWIVTPKSVRELGGALFGDRRYGRVFICHNGAESYYSVRGFRGLLRV
jgi:hypothetical protein